LVNSYMASGGSKRGTVGQNKGEQVNVASTKGKKLFAGWEMREIPRPSQRKGLPQMKAKARVRGEIG